MFEVFKLVVLCLICIILTSYSSTLLYSSALFFVLVVLFYDFDFETTIERHAINKIEHVYLKVRKFYPIIYPNIKDSSQYLYTPTMNNISKKNVEFDLSRFNKSGAVYSPISNQANSVSGTSRRLVQARQTSTPLTKNLPWQKNSITPTKMTSFQNSNSHRSPRYSLSTSAYNLSPKTDIHNTSSTPRIQTVAGPLLASTRFNVNLGTYTDTKSPGLASRVVQYHNELQGNQSSTHQQKYGSPGQFPIVQLYKKELPLLTRTPRRCTVRIAPPDHMSYSSSEANTILRDSFIQSTAESNAQGDTEINTKSVLDALKEISRKRIHANDEAEDLSKRQRKESVYTPLASPDNTNTNKDGKRLREDTPPKAKGTAVSPGTNIPKKICVTNEIESSLSSSRLMQLQQQGQKRKAAVENANNINKQRKIGNIELVSRETQTNSTNKTPVASSTQTVAMDTNHEEDSLNKGKQSTSAQTEDPECSELQTILRNSRRRKKTYNEKTIKEIDEEKSTLRFDPPQKVVQVFSEEPLEIMRKNKLAMAIAAISGQEPDLIPLPKMSLSTSLHKPAAEVKNSSEKAIHSILSPKNKTKHDKHVHFDIPNGDNNNLKSPDNNISDVTTSVNESQQNVESKISSINKTSSNENTTSSPFTLAFSTPPVAPVLTQSSTLTFTPAPSPTFNSPVNTNDISSNNNVNSMPVSVQNAPTKVNSLPFETAVISNNSTKQTEAVTFVMPQTPTLNFGSSPNIKVPVFGGQVASTTGNSQQNHPTNLSSLPVTTTVATTGINFVLSSNNNFNANTTSSSTSAALAFTTTTTNSTQLLTSPTTSNLTFGNNNVQPVISFETTKPTISFGSASLVGTKAPTSVNSTSINFGTSTNSMPVMSQTNPSFNNNTQTTPLTLPNNTGVYNSFGTKTEANSTNSAAFAFNSTSAPSSLKPGGFKFDLGKTPTTSTSTTTTDSQQKAVSVFGSNLSVEKSNNTFNFGSNTASATTAVPTFGTVPSTMFGSSVTTSQSTFGTVTTTSSNIFGVATSSAFSTTTASNLFGSSTTSPASSVFGTVVSTAPPAFGTITTPVTTSNNIFDSSALQQSTFGTTKTTDAPSGFATTFGTAASAPQNTGGFGTQQPSSGFGGTFGPTGKPTSNNTFSFGPNNNATTKPFAFNTANSNITSTVFGNVNSSFGTNTSAVGVFGAPVSTTNVTSVFGTPASTTSANTNVFGAPVSTAGGPSLFGTTTATTTASTFSQPSGNMFGTSSFGSTTSGPAFGTQNNNNNNNSSTFGIPAAATNTFGAPPNQTAPFGSAPTNQVAVFGGNAPNQASGFGSASNSTFGGFGTSTSTPVGAFGANAAQPVATGNFGVNTQTPNMGGFGTANTQSSAGGFGTFGTTTNPVPNQSAGVFAFGGPAQNVPAPATPSNAFQFGGNNTAKPAGFNFSTGASAPNINFGSGGATPAFGSSPAPGFGAPPAGQFNTAAPATGMFSIGSGSTAPKPRPVMKARRRNN